MLPSSPDLRRQPGAACHKLPRERTVIRLPSFEAVKADPVLYAHANRVLHLETNPGNARALVQAHGEGKTARRSGSIRRRSRWTTAEMVSGSGCPMRAARILPMPTRTGSHGARPRSRPGR